MPGCTAWGSGRKVSALVPTGYTSHAFTFERGMISAKCGSAIPTGAASSIRIFSPLMSMSWRFWGRSGPTALYWSTDHLLRATRYFPSGRTVSPW